MSLRWKWIALYFTVLLLVLAVLAVVGLSLFDNDGLPLNLEKYRYPIAMP